MNNEKDKSLDDVFRKGLEDPVHHAVYKENDWHALEEMLDKHTKRRGVIYWLPVLGSAAALLLLFLGWWMFRANPVQTSTKLQAANYRRQAKTGTGGPLRPPADHNNTASQSINHQQTTTGTSGGAVRQPIYHKQTSKNAANYYAGNVQNSKTGSAGKSFFTSTAAGSRRRTAGRAGDKQNVLSGEPIIANRDYAALTAVSLTPVFEAGITGSSSVSAYQINMPAIGAVKNSTSTGKEKIKIKSQQAFRPQFAISVLAAPDLNGVGSFQQSKVGTNVGLLFSAAVSKKFTISTGALYSVKPYLTNFEDYHTPYKFHVSPVNVTADCRMLDIPLNLGYQVYNKQQNRLSIGTGLSSYIMLHEHYTYNYNDVYAYGPSGYTVPKSGKYFFGVLNLNATYERQLNSKIAISAQPYLKLPLTNIGYGQVKLQSTGVAVGLKWNLNSLTKP
ncbi:MAG TPA: hypothetical protein VNW95_01970 [Mucilaginibacter sp.]|jgi:hypothetical protein|nr:hypothetical protein [Mucilaginibacter sp.]